MSERQRANNSVRPPLRGAPTAEPEVHRVSERPRAAEICAKFGLSMSVPMNGPAVAQSRSGLSNKDLEAVPANASEQFSTAPAQGSIDGGAGGAPRE